MTASDPIHDPEIFHDHAAQQFELRVGDDLCLLQYRIRDRRMIIHHTEVPQPLEGRGLAARMTRAALDFARTEKLLVEPRCSYAAVFFRKHPEYADLLG